MKNFKFKKRICSLLMVVAMLLGTSLSVFAAEPVSNIDTEKNSTENAEIMPLDAQYWGDIKAGTTGTVDVYLDSYLGLSKTFNFTLNRISNPPGGGLPSGTVKCWLNKDGKEYKYWHDIGPSSMGSVKLTLPSSGWYTFTVQNNSNIDINAVCQWN